MQGESGSQPAEIVEQRFGRGIPPGGIGLKCLERECVEVTPEASAQSVPASAGQAVCHDFARRLRRGVGPLPSQQFVQNYAEGVHVGRRGDGFTGALLWRGIFGGKEPLLGSRRDASLRRLPCLVV